MSRKIIDREYLVRNLANYKDNTLYMDKEKKIVDSPETYVVCDSSDADAILVDDINLSEIKTFIDSVTVGDYVKHVDEVSHNVIERVQKIANNLNAYFVRGKQNLKIELTNDEGYVLSSQEVNIPLESVIVGAIFNEDTNTIIFELKDGDVLEIPTSGMISGLVPDTRTIAGIDLTYDIESDALKDALDLKIEPIADDDIKSLFAPELTP